MIRIWYSGSEAFRLKFPPYSIAESGVRVKHVKTRVAEIISQAPDQIRLMYKDRELIRDDDPVKNYGVKQNSKISVVLTEPIKRGRRSFQADPYFEQASESEGLTEDDRVRGLLSAVSQSQSDIDEDNFEAIFTRARDVLEGSHKLDDESKRYYTP